MIISNTSEQAIQRALASTNKKFGGNVQFKNYQKLSDKRFQITLRVRDSKGSGAKVSKYMGKDRRSVSACWHVHGTFFDNLNPEARIYTAGKWTTPGAPWVDSNIGSMMHPVMFSESCYCGSGTGKPHLKIKRRN